MAISTAIDPSAIASVTGVKTTYKNLAAGNTFYLPQRAIIVGQGATASTYSTTKAQYFDAFSVGQAYGFGSPVHLAALQLLPTNGDGVGTIPVTVYPLDDDGAGVAAAGDITPTVGTIVQASYKVVVNNIESEPFVVEVGDAVADVIDKMVTAVNAVVEMPVIASDGTTTLDLACKWKGSSGNDLYLEVTGRTDAGMTWAYTQPTGGLNNPDVTTATDQIGNVWETMAVNCMEIADTDNLDVFSTVNEGKWLPTVTRPMVVFTGNTATTVASAITVPDARKTDRTNGQLVDPGSNDLPFVTAARQLARIIKVANVNPPVDYVGQQATGLTPGLDSAQWSDAEKNAAILGGSSTAESIDGVTTIGDVVTFYHPTGDPLPPWRHVKDIVRMQNIIFNLGLIFNAVEWKSAPLVPDDQSVRNPAARQPKDAVAAVAALTDSLAADAIISDPASAKKTIAAEIDSQNPNRLNVTVTYALTGNTKTKSVDFNFGFYFGGAAAA